MIMISHPTGNRNVRAVAEHLAEAGILAQFQTTLAARPSSNLAKLLPAALRSEWLRRSFSLPADTIRTRPALELARLTLPRLGFKGAIRHEKGWACIDAVYRDLDRAAARQVSSLVKNKGLTAVYAYEDGAMETFMKAKEYGVKCIYDLPIAYWETGRRLMQEEALRLPEWAATLGGGIYDSEEKLERKTAEMKLADVVVGPGHFVIDSLPSWAKTKEVLITPFGSPETGISQLTATAGKKDTTRPLRILFAGSMGQRKGLGDLFRAVQLLNTDKIELVVMGSLLAPAQFYRKQLSSFTFEPGRPHAAVLELMHTCDVLCLPSILEGRALVMQEAMSQGLPILITPNTGGADLVKEGETGFLVPIRSPEAIAEKLAWFLENRKATIEMGAEAREHASLYTWEKYGKAIVSSLTAIPA